MAVLDKQNAIPLYIQLKRRLEAQFADGTFPAHSRVPSERELSKQYAISRMTARKALSELIQEGRLYTSRGKGTFIAEPKIKQSLQALTSFTEDMRTRGFQPTTRVVRRELAVASPDVAQNLRVAEGSQVVCLERLRLADDEPMALEIAYLSFAGVEKLLLIDLGGSLYAVLRDLFDITPVEAIQEFEARLARPREHTLLKLGDCAPVLAIQRTTFDANHRPFEHVRSVYRGDRYRFVARLTREEQR